MGSMKVDWENKKVKRPQQAHEYILKMAILREHGQSKSFIKFFEEKRTEKSIHFLIFEHCSLSKDHIFFLCSQYC